jgi:beta-glucosidase/6-phospho-beta-glucosidase/beta-galactosidase
MGTVIDEIGIVRIGDIATLYHWDLKAWLTYWSHWASDPSVAASSMFVSIPDFGS